MTRGSALPITLLIITVLAVMIAGSLMMATTNRQISGNDALSEQAFSVAQAGSAFWKAELVSLYMHMANNMDAYEDDIQTYLANNPGANISCNNYFAIGVDLGRDGTIGPDEQLNANGDLKLERIALPVGDGEGNALTTFRLRGSAISLETVGNFARGRATVVEEFTISNIDIWNNAVFAADGAANATIRGRAEIRGAIHVLGEGLSDGGLALDLSGSFGLGNTYKNINRSLGVNAAQMRLTNPDPDDLCATLRVKRGNVQMGGSAQIGYKDDNPTDSVMHTMRGIYTNGEIKGGQEENNVFSENGMTARYDAGDNVDYPELNDTVEVNVDGTLVEMTRAKQLERSAITFARDTNDDDRWNSDLMFSTAMVKGDEYLSPGCYAPLFDKFGRLPPTPPVASPPWAGGAFLPSHADVVTVSHFVLGLHPLTRRLSEPLLYTWAHHRENHKSGDSANAGGGGGAAAGFVLDEGGTPDFTCRKYRVSGGSPNTDDEVVAEIRWDNNRDELYVGGTGGVVRFLGADLTLTGGGGSNVEIGYKGKGILFAESSNVNANGVAVAGSGGDINLEVDVLPATGRAVIPDDDGRFVDSSFDNSYPATTVLGLVARNSVVTSGAQKRYTAAVYAQESVDVTKQTLVAGAIVTKSFNAGSQVPTVLYVPNLANSVPALMPGAGGNGFSVSEFSWTRR